ncbi:MAG TPA: hypothetical protein VLN49_09535 [Gemmatimonadaceae bacterium]|nr:hypothetical protein [Gemmatimonadaceae bacterium]
MIMNSAFEESLHEPSARRYCADLALDESIDALVRDRRATGASLDDTIDTVSTLVRTIAPVDVAPSANDWETRWREYFGFYDHTVARAIRSYVEHAVQPG